MKRFILSAVALIAGLISAPAQELQLLPNDPAVRQGKLDNGMTYYIRHNDKPENRAEFYLATNVGAIQEEPDQDGLAHFLEHMCFNGTKNFPGKSLLNWLESIGASFGGNVNASTGVEVTQYMLNNIPLVRESVVDTCLLIMHDYSHFVTCDPVEIDNERGVILEERRTRRDASWRMREKAFPYYYGDTKYATCSIIGSQENLQTFKPESLLNFYYTWYRPDLQALIVVGDIDVDLVESKIKTIFADIPAPENPKPKDVITIPDNSEPLVGIITDPENSSSSIELLWKSPARPEVLNNTTTGMMLDLVESIIGSIMNERMADIVAVPGAPFINAGFQVVSLCETLEASLGQVIFKEGEAIPALKAFYTEVEKMKRYGFSEAEIERVKTELLSQYEAAANRAESRKNSEFVPDLINNFFDNYPYMDPAVEYQYAQAILAQIPAELINAAAAQLITDENLVVLYTSVEKDGLSHPTEAQLLNVVRSVKASEIEAPEAEDVPTEFLDPSTLKGAKVKKEKTSIYGSTEWTLKNGLKVILYPTDYEKDRISFLLYKNGGMSLIETEDLPSFEANIQSMFTSYNGVSDYTASQVSKMLAGKQLAVEQNISALNTGLAGYSTVKDFETALQLIYLQYTDPRFDEDAYAQTINTLSAVLPNYLNLPDTKLQKELNKTLYDDNPRSRLIDETTLDRASLATIERVTRMLYKDIAGSKIIIAGDFDKDEIKPLVEKYLGSLPKGKKAPEWIDRKESITTKTVTNDFKVDMQTPKTTVYQVLRRDEAYSVDKLVAYEALNYILDMVYVETLREEEGGTYGASVQASLSRIPKAYGYLLIGFDTNPSSADKLRALALDGLKKLAENGPDADQFDKALKNLQKTLPESKIKNSFWMNAIKLWYDSGIDYALEYEHAIETLTPDKVKAVADAFYNHSNLIEVIMRPDKSAEKE